MNLQPYKSPKLCLVCKRQSASVYRVCSSSGEEKNLKQLIERYGGVGVRRDDVICRNCLSRLQTVHKLSTDIRHRCQTNAARDGGTVLMTLPATLTIPQSAPSKPSGAEQSSHNVSTTLGKSASTPGSPAVAQPSKLQPPGASTAKLTFVPILPKMLIADMACFLCGNTSVGHMRVVNPHSQGKMKYLPAAIEETFGVRIDFNKFNKLRACITCFNNVMKAQRLKRNMLASLTNTPYKPPPTPDKFSPEQPSFGDPDVMYCAEAREGVTMPPSQSEHFRKDDHTYCSNERPTERADRIIKKGGIFRRKHGKLELDHGLVEAFKGDQEVRDKIEQMLLLDVKTNCDRMCSVSTPPGPSVLRMANIECLEKADLVSAIIIEMEQTMPFLLDIFKTVCSPVHAMAANTKRTVATMYAMAMYCRNPQLCAMQILNSLGCVRYQSRNHLLDVMQKCSFTLFSSRKKAMLKRAAENPAMGLTVSEKDGKVEKTSIDYLIDRIFEVQNFPIPRGFVPQTVKKENIKKEVEEGSQSSNLMTDADQDPNTTRPPTDTMTSPTSATTIPVNMMSLSANLTPTSGNKTPRPANKTPRSLVKKEPGSTPTKKRSSKPKTPRTGQKRKSTDNPKKRVKTPKKAKCMTTAACGSQTEGVPVRILAPHPKTTIIKIPSHPQQQPSEVDTALTNLYGEIVEMDMEWIQDENFVQLTEAEVVCMDE